MEQKVFHFENVTEWSQVKEDRPDALVVNAQMLSGDKFVELCLPEEERVFKGRMVAGGHNVRDSQGAKVETKTAHKQLISMAEIRTTQTVGMPHEKPKNRKGRAADEGHAYRQLGNAVAVPLVEYGQQRGNDRRL